MVCINGLIHLSLINQKKNLTRDFSDGVNFTQIIIKYTGSKILELHNIVPTYFKKQKLENWKIIQTKLKNRTIIKLTDTQINDIVDLKPYAIENVLQSLHTILEMEEMSILKTKENSQIRNYMKNINSK